MDKYASHLPALCAAVHSRWPGSAVIETGCGFYSSPTIHAMLATEPVPSAYIIIEPPGHWRDQIEPLCPSAQFFNSLHDLYATDLLSHLPVGVLFIDNGPRIRHRAGTLTEILDSNITYDTMIVHDLRTAELPGNVPVWFQACERLLSLGAASHEPHWGPKTAVLKRET